MLTFENILVCQFIIASSVSFLATLFRFLYKLSKLNSASESKFLIYDLPVDLNSVTLIYQTYKIIKYKHKKINNT